MTNLDPTFVDRAAVDDSERAFAKGLQLAMNGDITSAELLFDSLSAQDTDDAVRAAAKVLLTAMLQYQGKWKSVASLAGNPAQTGDARVDKAAVRTWARAFRDVPLVKLTFPRSPVNLPLTFSEAGTPLIPVSMGGRTRLFWIDTGSSMSILSSDVAEAAGIEALIPDTLEMVTVTGRVAARPSVIREMALGGLKVENATAMIIDRELLHIRLSRDRPGPPIDARIDGIIGFDILSRIDLRLDYSRSRTTLAKPVVDPSAIPERRNLFWLGTPVVRLLTAGGIPAHFHLDTGAQETYSTDGLIGKARSRTFVGERRVMGGIAGAKGVKGRFVRRVQLWLAGRSLFFERLLVIASPVSAFVALDGILGSDTGNAGIVRIDATNGLFSIESPARDDAITLRRPRGEAPQNRPVP